MGIARVQKKRIYAWPKHIYGRGRSENAELAAAKKFVLDVKAAGMGKEFCEALRDFIAQGLSKAQIPVLITRAKRLFRGHRHLLLGFVSYLPEEYKFTVPAEEGN